MPKWLNDNDILMYLTYNEDKSRVTEKFIKMLIGKMTANDVKSYLG